MKRALTLVARRVAWAIAVVALASSASLLVSFLLPGDPARVLLGPQASAADVDRARAIYGFDRPIAVRFARHVARLVHRGPSGDEARSAKEHASCATWGRLHVDLGMSFTYRKPVVDLLATKAPRSIDLALAALFVQLALGGAAGLLAASRRGRRVDDVTMSATLVAVSAPTFLTGLLFQYLFAYRLRVLPYDGYGTTAASRAIALVLPALTLGVYGTALYARVVRDEVAASLDAPFTRAARARGASRVRVLVVHALRQAMLPIATLAALDLGALVSGAVVTESIFRWPGLGQMAVEAVLNRDGPAIFGTVLVTSSAVVLLTLTLDLAASLLDPRVRRS